MNLYEINEKIISLVDETTGEILDFDQFENLALERDIKLENIALWIKNLKSDIVALKAEKDKFAEREKQAENKLNKLTQYLMELLDGKSFKTAKVDCSYRKSVVVEVDDNVFYKWANELRKDLLTFKEAVANKVEIKKALKNGDILIGAKLLEKNNIQIK